MCSFRPSSAPTGSDQGCLGLVTLDAEANNVRKRVVGRIAVYVMDSKASALNAL
ncbi:hypothetical protein UFOVP1313_59 [uncultured Caudovirales phage]|uniref:Uncharacterized protein n=1 Tax=uncultured Caudovirales phage TaxID=2100421 RepID=A0A6J5RQE0_9CAUD|nr:hypothetical protein UFOVP1313_59 [uncultured Caudovirales phage]